MSIILIFDEINIMICFIVKLNIYFSLFFKNQNLILVSIILKQWDYVLGQYSSLPASFSISWARMPISMAIPVAVPATGITDTTPEENYMPAWPQSPWIAF